MPFRIVFGILKFFLFPWYVRWIFRLPWIVFAGLAAWVGYLAYQEYENYRFNVFEAGYQVSEGVPDPTPLSKWNSVSDVYSNDEVHVSGLYFSALPQGQFDPVGLERGFILLADDQGREVKAALVVRPNDLPFLQRQLEAQGDGDRIAVNVNGTLSRSSDWLSAIETELLVMNIPGSPDLVVIKPFLGNRADALHDAAENSFGMVSLLGGLAGVLAFLGAGRFLSGRGARLAASAHQSRKSGREVQAEKQAAQAAQNLGLPDQAPEASPWGTFQPQPRDTDTSDKPTRMVKPQTPAQVKASRAKPKREADVVIPTEPEYKSVFPGGGSAFRFKTADQIIKQTFGVRSGLKSSEQTIKSSKGEE
ncbi:YtpI family protein [Octadecabacter temperatus]|nr:YtpI family protein [Octadecabacter temperatus]